MGLLKLNQYMQRQRRRRRIKGRNESIALQSKTKGPPCKQDENPLAGQIQGYSRPNLPEDIWRHIHSLMPMQDAARAACAFEAFVDSWRCHPNLIFSEETLGLNENAYRKDEKMRYFTNIVDHIMKKHKGIGVKTFKLETGLIYNQKDCSHLDRLDSWLQIAFKQGIEELSLNLCPITMYKVLCSLLSGRTVESLRCLLLASCVFSSTVKFGCFKSLTTLQLCSVHIKEDNLRCFVFNTYALERFELLYCSSIESLNIPCLQRLTFLVVSTFGNLKVVANKAPNLSSFHFLGDLNVQLSLGDTLQIKELYRYCNNAVYYARTELPSLMPNLETLTIYSDSEMVNTPIVPNRFFHLKFLNISVGGLYYDIFSMVSFIDASPYLETFILDVLPERAGRASIFAEPSSGLRSMPKHRHDKLKRMEIIHFTSAKTLVELTCQVLESARSLEHLTLDTTNGGLRCSVSKSGKCFLMRREALVEAHRALLAVESYVKPKVPSTLDLNVLEPCRQCHAGEIEMLEYHNYADAGVVS